MSFGLGKTHEKVFIYLLIYFINTLSAYHMPGSSVRTKINLFFKLAS